MKHYLGLAFVASAVISCTTVEPTPSPQQLQLEARVDDAINVQKNAPGMAVVVIGADKTSSYAAAAGVADPDGRAFTTDTPVRIASITKTFTAATVLRLWEQGQIDLDASIDALIDEEFDALLRGDGYDTQAITVRHLLMHTAGLPDHADQSYVGIVMSDPTRKWTRRDQVALAVEAHDPLGAPNEKFSYSDTGYILLGDIIENITGDALASAVRRELKFAEIGLNATWWEQVEQPPTKATPRAHQYLGGQDTTDWDGSIDLYGGGGLIMSANDLARFMAALMRGEIFDDPATLETMLTAPGNPSPNNYRIGLFPRNMAGASVFSHEGFWGTQVLYLPDYDVAIGAAVLDQTGYRTMMQTVGQTIRDITAGQNGAEE